MRPTTATRIALLLAILEIAACTPAVHEQEPEGLDEPFAFQMNRSLPIDISVKGEDGPIPGVVITVRTDPAEVDVPAMVIWTGMTDRTGRATGVPSLPEGETRVAVIITKRGLQGPYAQEELRTQLGPVAPASWIRTSPDQLSGLSVLLTRRLP